MGSQSLGFYASWLHLGGGVVKELGKGRCEGSDQDKLREGRGLFPLASLVTAHQPREVRAGTQPGKQEGKQEPQTSSSAGLPPTAWILRQPRTTSSGTAQRTAHKIVVHENAPQAGVPMVNSLG